MFIASVSKVLPENKCNQEELIGLLEVLRGEHKSALPSRFAKFHRSVQVENRYLALPASEYRNLTSFSKANKAFIDVGTDLGARAISSCLECAGVAPEQVDAIFFTTVTGLAVPTIDARLINRLHLRKDIKRLPFFGLGCVAGVAGIARMYDYLEAFPNQMAVLLSVELCSLTFQPGDPTVANMIATGLFGDGAAAVLGIGDRVTGKLTRKKIKIIRTKSSFYTDSEDVMGWEIGEKGFRIILNASVPQFVTDHLGQDVDLFLGEVGLARKDISSWVCHPGGPKVLEAMEETLDIPREELDLTWNSLREVGNMSSASVLFVLADTLKERRKNPGEFGVMIAMGPGFCSELVLFRWE